MSAWQKVSVHGGHSGDFCGHAIDGLEAVVEQYVAQGFEWICLTEHMPAAQRALMGPEETAQGLDPAALQVRFDRYFAEARRLKERYKNQIEIFAGFETEGYSGYEAEVAALIARHDPDMIVGSVHHVHDVLFDGSPADYERAIALSGSIERLYCDYFDKQLELIERFQPAVVGHFDLIRIFDPDYRQRWEVAAVRDRALRNLERIGALGLILDLNVRALTKGADEPYLSEPLMAFAIEQGIAMTPGDDSHGVASVGTNLALGVDILQQRGGHTRWQKPAVGRHVT